MKTGPFRVHTITALPPAEGGKGQRVSLKLVNPAMPGLLHEVAEALMQRKAAEGIDFIVEDPRTTQLLWTTAGAKKEARQ